MIDPNLFYSVKVSFSQMFLSGEDLLAMLEQVSNIDIKDSKPILVSMEVAKHVTIKNYDKYFLLFYIQLN